MNAKAPTPKKARPKPGKPGVCLHCGEAVSRAEGKGIGQVHTATGKAVCK